MRDLGLGDIARFHPVFRLAQLLLGEANGLVAHIDLKPRRHQGPVGALDRGDGLRDGAAQRSRGALTVRVGDAHGKPRLVRGAIAQERLPQLGAHPRPIRRGKERQRILGGLPRAPGSEQERSAGGKELLERGAAFSGLLLGPDLVRRRARRKRQGFRRLGPGSIELEQRIVGSMGARDPCSRRVQGFPLDHQALVLPERHVDRVVQGQGMIGGRRGYHDQGNVQRGRQDESCIVCCAHHSSPLSVSIS